MNIKKIILSFIILNLISTSFIFSDNKKRGIKLPNGQKYIASEVVFDKGQ
jgi:hypothetical protein